MIVQAGLCPTSLETTLLVFPRGGSNVPLHEKNNHCDFRTVPTQGKPYKYRRWLEAGNFGFRKSRNCTIHAEKNKSADQLRSYCKADLRLCFSDANVGFLMTCLKFFTLNIKCTTKALQLSPKILTNCPNCRVMSYFKAFLVFYSF